MTMETMEKLVSIIDSHSKNIEYLIAHVSKMQERIDGLDKIVFDYERRIAEYEEEIVKLKTTITAGNREFNACNDLHPRDQDTARDNHLPTNDQAIEIQRERRVVVINDLESQTHGEILEDKLTEKAHYILRQHTPSLKVNDIVFVKMLKSYKNNCFRLLVEVSNSELAERMVLNGRKNGANVRLGKPRSVRKFMKEQYQKCSDMNRARQDGCGYYFRIEKGTRIIRVEDSMKETPSNLGLPRPSRVKKLSDRCGENRKKDEAVSKEIVRKSPCNEVTPTVSEDNLVPTTKVEKPKNTGNTKKIGTNKVTQAYMEKEVSKGKPKLMLYYDSEGNFSWIPGGKPVYKNKVLAEHYRDTEILNSLQN